MSRLEPLVVVVVDLVVDLVVVVGHSDVVGLETRRDASRAPAAARAASATASAAAAATWCGCRSCCCCYRSTLTRLYITALVFVGFRWFFVCRI
jgi:hypothetical protein